MNAIYLGLTGASARERQVETVANNLANVSTNGFKGDRLRFESILLSQEGGVGVRGTLPTAHSWPPAGLWTWLYRGQA